MPFKPLARSPLLILALVAACGHPERTEETAPRDPVIAGALAGEIMVDPDLVGQNPQGAGLSGGGPASALIPLDDASAETIAAARAEGARLLGGRIVHAPVPAQGGPSGAGETAALTADGALAASGASRDCARKVDYTMAWAARVPPAFPIYPRGHVQEAAGTDKDGCRLRVVNYLTPVPSGDVLDFYWTRAHAAAMAATHRIEGADHVIAARAGTAAYVVYVRNRAGMTEVDLVTSGG